jgi:hypothetical protein
MKRIINIATENFQAYFFIQIHKQIGIVSRKNLRLQTAEAYCSPAPQGLEWTITNDQSATSILT